MVLSLQKVLYIIVLEIQAWSFNCAESKTWRFYCYMKECSDHFIQSLPTIDRYKLLTVLTKDEIRPNFAGATDDKKHNHLHTEFKNVEISVYKFPKVSVFEHSIQLQFY